VTASADAAIAPLEAQVADLTQQVAALRQNLELLAAQDAAFDSVLEQLQDANGHLRQAYRTARAQLAMALIALDRGHTGHGCSCGGDGCILTRPWATHELAGLAAAAGTPT